MNFPAIEYVADASVDPALDVALRRLLCTCFPKTPVFRDRRYYNEPPAHRWLIRGSDGDPVAHVAVHEKLIFYPAIRNWPSEGWRRCVPSGFSRAWLCRPASGRGA